MEAIEAEEYDDDDDEEEEEVDCGLPAVEAMSAAPSPPGSVSEIEAIRVTVKRQRKPSKSKKAKRISFGKFELSGRAAEVAQRAKLQFGGIPMTDYNRVAVKRWLNRELRAIPNVRTKDLLTWLPTMELYVFYRTQADVDFELAVEELKNMGLLRGGNP